MGDLINRKDAIDAIKVVLDDGGEWFIEAINDIPSAGQNCILCEYYTEIETDDGIKGKCTRRTGSDLISRQDAIEAIATVTMSIHLSNVLCDKLLALPSADAVQIPIKLEKRYPQSRDEDITDAFMRGYLAGRSSADAVEVVRCKDCKHAHITYGGECKYCDKWEEDGEALYLEGDFFCAYGERREP